MQQANRTQQGQPFTIALVLICSTWSRPFWALVSSTVQRELSVHLESLNILQH